MLEQTRENGQSLSKTLKISPKIWPIHRRDWPGIYNFCGWLAASEADSPADNGWAAHIGGRMLKWVGKIRSCRKSFTKSTAIVLKY